jgi:hypothetical protein
MTDPNERLDSFDAAVRKEAFLACIRDMQGNATSAQNAYAHNLHCHSFFSYNGYGYSPTRIAFIAKKREWFGAGLVDFDVLDGVDEFLSACQALDIRAACGMETRVFVPEFRDRVINSPGEPGIAYHVGIGFTSGTVPEQWDDFLDSLRNRASNRTREIAAKVNRRFSPLELDFERDVIPLTPSGNATERHVCHAYATKAEAMIPDLRARGVFWSERLDTKPDEIVAILGDSVRFEALIRAKTMKAGGIGYRKPEPSSFPPLSEMNRFILGCGAIPLVTWLDGTSEGEKAQDELFDLHESLGTAAVSIIPDRNWNLSDPQAAKEKIGKLNSFIEGAVKRCLPIVIGTEMNAPGQKLADDFDSPALAPHRDLFLNGAAIICAHTMLQPFGLGYLSEWAKATFPNPQKKNTFYALFGQRCSPRLMQRIQERISPECSPSSLLALAETT